MKNFVKFNPEKRTEVINAIKSGDLKNIEDVEIPLSDKKEDIEHTSKLLDGLQNNLDNTNIFNSSEKENLKNFFGTFDFKGINLSDPIETLQNKKYHTLENLDKAWIQTHSGKKIYPLNLNPNDIDIKDIAHALSNLCRFTGHVNKFHSVAYHSVLVSYFCNFEDAKHALLHDVSEYAIADIASPIKRTNIFNEYRVVESNIQKTIYRKFGLSEEEPKSVKEADLFVLCLEAKCLLKNLHPDFGLPYNVPDGLKIKSLSPKKAKKAFLNRFEELFDIAV